MILMLVYLVLIIAGNLVAYGIGLVVERPQLVGLSVEGPTTTLSLTVFLAAYFANLWVAWRIAVRITRPRGQPAAA